MKEKYNTSKNIMLKGDSYKVTHHTQTPKGTTKVSSYLESRGGDYEYTVFVLLQYILEKHLSGKQVTLEKIDPAEMFWNTHFGYSGLFNRDMWEHIATEHGGRLPIRIKAVPEGTVVPVKNVLATFENTDDKCASLTNFLETIILQAWAPITVATNSRTIKVELLKRIMHTSDMTFEEASSAVLFMLHDFGFRGVSSYETASILGAAHLTSFMGTDTVPGIILLMNYYNAEMCGFSVAASEHSTATPWGRGDGERQYAINMLKQHPNVICSLVSDSYNVFEFVDTCTTDKEILSLIKNRPAKTVFRPDSGNPVDVNRKLLKILQKNLMSDITINSKGYKVLPVYIGLLQGDGIDKTMVNQLLDMLEEEGWCATTLIYGSGGGLLQKFNRDTQKFAIKCSFMIINGKEVNVQKDPITAPGKKSKTGKLKLVKDEAGKFFTASSNDYSEDVFDLLKDEMVIVFEDGILYNKSTLEQIRERAQVTKDEVNIYDKLNTLNV
jgi:nicotinamide phosphoribosyltransferase